MFKFDVDGDTRDKLEFAEIEGVLRPKGDVLCMFLEHVGTCDSNEMEV